MRNGEKYNIYCVCTRRAGVKVDFALLEARALLLLVLAFLKLFCRNDQRRGEEKRERDAIIRKHTKRVVDGDAMLGWK